MHDEYYPSRGGSIFRRVIVPNGFRVFVYRKFYSEKFLCWKVILPTRKSMEVLYIERFCFCFVLFCFVFYPEGSLFRWFILTPKGHYFLFLIPNFTIPNSKCCWEEWTYTWYNTVINHGILLYKLEYYGFRGVALDWFKSYLGNRKQFVRYQIQDSDHKMINCGVPQESIIGSLLFILYINDIVNTTSLFELILFADDTILLFSHPDIASQNEIVHVLNFMLCFILLFGCIILE